MWNALAKLVLSNPAKSLCLLLEKFVPFWPGFGPPRLTLLRVMPKLL